jgi:hypothetical protein
MGAKQENLIGLKFNHLTVLSLAVHNEYKNYRKRYWECLCDCGNVSIVATAALTTNKTKSCGCIKAISNAINSRTSRYKLAKPNAGYFHIYKSYENNAIKRNKLFQFEFEDFIELLKGNCYYCGIEPSNVYSKNYYNVTYNGVDRIDNIKGYTKENSVSFCKMCNISKNNNTEEEFTKWIKRTYENLEKLKRL